MYDSHTYLCMYVHTFNHTFCAYIQEYRHVCICSHYRRDKSESDIISIMYSRHDIN